MITTVCKISYGSQTVPPIVPAVQGDTGRAISFEIADFTPPAGATATYFILKPSGEAIYNSATITDNSILCELTAQSLAEAGENRMQVRVLHGEDIVTSFEVILMVRTFLGDDAIESGTEMNIFDQAVEQATEQFQENAEQIVEEVIESIPADYTALTEEVDELNERLDTEGLSEDVKTALLNCFAHVAWKNGDGQEYYDALEDALASDTSLVSISAVYTQSGTVWTDDNLDSLKTDLVVTATYDDSTTRIIPSSNYNLSGTLSAGTSPITVIYGSKTTTFDVTVTAHYTFYDYIYNDDDENAHSVDGWVDTGLTMSPSWGTLNVEFEAVNRNAVSSSDAIFGANNGNNADTSNILWYARANKGGFSTYTLGVAKQLNMAPGDTRCVCKYFFVDGGESYLQYGNNNVAVATVSASSITQNNKTLILAGGYSFSELKAYGLRSDLKTQLGYIKFSDPTTGDVLYHFKPCKDNKTNRYGYYDIIGNVFYPQNGDADVLKCGNWGA